MQSRGPAPLRPYLDRLHGLVDAYPALTSFLGKILHEDAGRLLVRDHYNKKENRGPGRCHCLIFKAHEVCRLDDYPDGFKDSGVLKNYLKAHEATRSRENGERRLFILEDTDPDFVDVLGENLGIDPLVFCEQMNTWNFADSSSIPHRGLPSVSSPQQSFTLRYYEIRALKNPSSIDALTFQMTFAVNRRRYERWRDVKLPLDRLDTRHSFVRRCASFWTSLEGKAEHSGSGWDAVIMVDPGMLISGLDPNTCLILKSLKTYEDRAALWNAETWDDPNNVEAIQHYSTPYHDGCPTLAPLLFPHISPEAQNRIATFQERKNYANPLDELVFYWTRIASAELIAAANDDPSNTTYYLLKHVAQHWTNQLELINCTVAMGEYFSDDYQAQIDQLSGLRWKADLGAIAASTKDINYMRRQMNHFWRAMVLNLERLGVQLGREDIDKSLPLALAGAQKDFLTLYSRLKPLRQRVESLTTMANELASLRAAFQGTHDSDFSLRLGFFASAVFPLTLVASILSMGDDFLPGKDKFWVFWAVSVPLFAASWIVVNFGYDGLLQFLVSWADALKKKKSANGRAMLSPGPHGGGAGGGLVAVETMPKESDKSMC